MKDIKQLEKKERIGFNDTEIKLISMIKHKTKDIYHFFSHLHKSKGSTCAMILIKGDNLIKTILKEKRQTDIFVDLEIEDMYLIILTKIKRKEPNGFIRRMMSGIKQDSGDFASIVEVSKNVDIEEVIFTLVGDYLNILTQPLEWRTGQISYNKI